MLIVPGVAAQAGSNLYAIIKSGISGFDEFSRKFLVITSGDFFLNLVLQSGGTGFLSGIAMIADLLGNYGSTYITINYRRMLSDSEPWRKDETEIFQYGFFYAQILTMLAITFVFAPVMPVIALCTAFFLFCRFICDSHLILLVHKFQIESSGTLISKVSRILFWILMLSQLTALLGQVFKGYYMSASFIGIILGFTMILYIFFWKSIISPQVFPDVKEQPTEKTLYKWWRFYTHPLIASLDPNIYRDNLPGSFAGTSMFEARNVHSFQNKSRNLIPSIVEDDDAYFEMEDLGKL